MRKAVSGQIFVPNNPRLKIVRKIGAGGMGMVFEAIDLEQNRPVAVKTLREVSGHGLLFFKREFRACANVVHPKIINLYEMFSDGDHLYYTMELIPEAESFLQHIKKNSMSSLASEIDLEATTDFQQMPETDAGLPFAPHRDMKHLRLSFLQLAKGIQALHEAGLLHRDLKPGNVLVGKSGEVKIVDFGLVFDWTTFGREATKGEALPEDASTTASESMATLSGTASYMSPEQARGDQLGPASDWYAFGVMLFEALTGTLPLSGPPMEVIKLKQTKDLSAPSSNYRGIREDLNDLCERLLKLDSGARPTAEEIVAVLRQGSGLTAELGAAVATNLSFVNRSAELQCLQDARDSTNLGRPTILRVEGASGIGKSALINHFLDGVKDSVPLSIVLRGVCNERDSTPFKAVDPIVDSLTELFLSMQDDDFSALPGESILAIRKLFPVLDWVVEEKQLHSAQEERPVQAPKEQRDSVFDEFQILLACLGEQHQLIIWIDDIHWADQDSIELLCHLFLNEHPPRVFLILSHREEERSKSLSQLVEALESQDVANEQYLRVDVLEKEHVNQLIERDSQKEVSIEILEWLNNESGGNPLFVHEIARYVDSHPSVGSDKQIELNEVLWGRISALPEDQQDVLSVISVAGQGITLRELQNFFQGTSVTDALISLRANHLVRSSGPGLDHKIEVFHDRIRVTVGENIDEQTRSRIQEGLVSVFENSGQKAPDVLAALYEVTGDSEKAGLHYLAAAKSAIRVMAFDQAGQHYEKANALTDDPIRKASILDRMVHFYTDLADFESAYRCGREAVACLGFELPESFQEDKFKMSFGKALETIGSRAPIDLLDLPEIDDVKLQQVVKIMAGCLKAAYQIHPQLCVAAATELVNVCLQEGNAHGCSIGYMVFGVIFRGGILGDYPTGYDFGRLVLALVDEFEDRHLKAEANFVIGYFGTSWLRPAQEAESLWKVAMRSGAKTGDLFHLGCASLGIIMSQHMRGVPVADVIAEAKRHRQKIGPLNLVEPLEIINRVSESLDRLSGTQSDSTSPTLETFDSLDQIRSRHFATYGFVVGMSECYLKEEYELAAQIAERGSSFLQDAAGVLHFVEFIYYNALIGAALDRPVEGEMLETLSKLAEGNPANFSHKHELLRGEKARLNQAFGAAIESYNRAIELGEKHNYRNVSALANRLLAKVHLARGNTEEADKAKKESTQIFTELGFMGLCQSRR